jgi:hypothetical protein
MMPGHGSADQTPAPVTRSSVRTVPTPCLRASRSTRPAAAASWTATPTDLYSVISRAGNDAGDELADLGVNVIGGDRPALDHPAQLEGPGLRGAARS